MKKRLLSGFLTLALALSLAPTALAAEGRISRLPPEECPEAPESKDFSQYVTGKLLSKEELTLEGKPFYEYTYSEAKALLPFKEQSAPSSRQPEEGEHEQYMTWAHDPTACSSVSHYVGSDGLASLEYGCCDVWGTEEFTVIDIGVRGIKTGDSLESVLQALGVSAEGAPIIAAEMMNNHTNFELLGDAKYGMTEGSSYDHHTFNDSKRLDAPRVTWRRPDGIQLELDFFLGRLGDVHMGDSTKIPASPFPEETEKPDPTAPSFTDVSPDAWYADPVAWAVNEGITNGATSTTFAPGQDCTHAQILTFLHRAADKPAPARECPVAVADAYADAVNWAYGEGLIDDSFDPNASCTRSQAVHYIWQALYEPSAQASSFTDVPAGAPYAKAVDWAVEMGITKGDGGADTFAPDKVCTRGHIVTFLYRAYNN